MSMTREQAIKHIEDIRASALKNLGAKYAHGCEGYYRTRIELSDICLTALRPVSRERVAKVWRAHWNESTHLGGFVYCSRCGYNALEANNYTFCPKCGSPFTDEAVEMVMERMEGIK